MTKTSPTDDLARLIEQAAKHVMTPEETWEQRLSWIFGEMNMNRDAGDEISKEQIVEMLAKQGIYPPTHVKGKADE